MQYFGKTVILRKKKEKKKKELVECSPTNKQVEITF
jgi:hypothetical protein